MAVHQNEILEFLKNHRSEMDKNFGVIKIGLFGSFARNEANENSDIDILFEFAPGTQNIFEKKLKLSKYLKECLKRDINLCREKYFKPYAKEHVKQEVIYVSPSSI